MLQGKLTKRAVQIGKAGERGALATCRRGGGTRGTQGIPGAEPPWLGLSYLILQVRGCKETHPCSPRQPI